MKDIFLGKFFGYDMVLRGVPDRDADHIKNIATKQLERMDEAYTYITFRGSRLDLEVIRSLKK